MGSRNPQSFFWTVALPTDQVLYTTALSTYVQDLFNSVNGVIIEEPGGWWGVGWRAQATGKNRFDLGYVKYGNSKMQA